MLTLRTLEGRMFAIEHDAITALEEAADHTMVWCGNQLHRVKEDFETVCDMWMGTEPDGETLGVYSINPVVLHSHLVDQGESPDAAAHTVQELVHRSRTAGQPNYDDTGHPVVTPPVEPKAE